MSPFRPITNPINCPWGKKAFTGYLGSDQKQWLSYDSSELMKASQGKTQIPALVDRGDADNFLEEQLKPAALQAAAKQSEYPLTLRMQAGYDHSYYFISSFIADHIRFHHQHF